MSYSYLIIRVVDRGFRFPNMQLEKSYFWPTTRWLPLFRYKSSSICALDYGLHLTTRSCLDI